jgi:hypothetical protein
MIRHNLSVLEVCQVKAAVVAAKTSRATPEQVWQDIVRLTEELVGRAAQRRRIEDLLPARRALESIFRLPIDAPRSEYVEGNRERARREMLEHLNLAYDSLLGELCRLPGGAVSEGLGNA